MDKAVCSFRKHGVVCLAAIAALLVVPASAAATELQLQAAGAGPDGDGSLGPAATTALEQGYLVPDQAAYESAKARKHAQAEQSDPAAADEAAPESLAPVLSRNWLGISNSGSAPSDSTGAVGSTRYIELINRNFAIYNKTSNTPISTGTLNTLFDQASASNSFDPQVNWDPDQNRFWYAGDTVVSSSDNRVSIGFSKSASPNNGTTDWCHYQVTFGSRFPDYPKIGDSRYFAIVGVNSFVGNSFAGADAFAFGKPPSGTITTCPAASSFKFGSKLNLTGPANSGTGTEPVFTPVPVNQTDPSATGYIVARTLDLPSSRLSIHRVTRDSTTGNPVFQSPGLAVTVPAYTFPADAVQKSPSTKLLDTHDARPTQAVSAIDPARLTTTPGAIWIQHTTAINSSTPRASVRWYEINPFNRTLLQSGSVASSFYNFNAAISPDRKRLGTATAGGSSMVMGFSASSTTVTPLVRMVSKVGTAAQSAPVTVTTSPGNYIGFDCAGSDNLCRWGDYSAATPDPNPPSGQTRVWLTNQYASGGTSTAQANWRTRNWAAVP